MEAQSLLLAGGGRRHIFSAIALGDPGLMRDVVEQTPDALDRRLSGRYHGQTALHFAIERNHPDLMGVLIGLGADLDAADGNGQTPLEFAMMRGNLGNRHPDGGRGEAAADDHSPDPATITGLAALESRAPLMSCARETSPRPSSGCPRNRVQRNAGRYPEDGPVTFWGHVTLGKAELTFDVRVPSPRRRDAAGDDKPGSRPIRAVEVAAGC